MTLVDLFTRDVHHHERHLLVPMRMVLMGSERIGGALERRPLTDLRWWSDNFSTTDLVEVRVFYGINDDNGRSPVLRYMVEELGFDDTVEDERGIVFPGCSECDVSVVGGTPTHAASCPKLKTLRAERETEA